MLLLAGRSWKVTHIDWHRHRCFVEPADAGGRAKWSGFGGGVSFEITRGMRAVLLGGDSPGVTLTRRAAGALDGLRLNYETVGRRAACGGVAIRRGGTMVDLGGHRREPHAAGVGAGFDRPAATDR